MLEQQLHCHELARRHVWLNAAGLVQERLTHQLRQLHRSASDAVNQVHPVSVSIELWDAQIRAPPGHRPRATPNPPGNLDIRSRSQQNLLLRRPEPDFRMAGRMSLLSPERRHLFLPCCGTWLTRRLPFWGTLSSGRSVRRIEDAIDSLMPALSL
jgi:hypothetical protein